MYFRSNVFLYISQTLGFFRGFLRDAGHILFIQMDIEESHCSGELIASAKYTSSQEAKLTIIVTIHIYIYIYNPYISVSETFQLCLQVLHHELLDHCQIRSEQHCGFHHQAVPDSKAI